MQYDINEIKNFNILNNSDFIFNEKVNPKNSESSNPFEATFNSFLAPIVYKVNPVTFLAENLSGFKREYWDDYNLKWINAPYPNSVVYHMQNHYRCVALTYLKRSPMNAINIEKIANILTGFPFTIVSGVVDIKEQDDNYIINQYAFEEVIPENENPTFSYIVPNTFSLKCQTGDVLDIYAPIVNGLYYYDNKNGNFWLESEFDVDFKSVEKYLYSETNYNFQKNKFVGLIFDTYHNVTFSFSFFEKFMATHFPKNLYLFFRQYYADEPYQVLYGNSFVTQLLSRVAFNHVLPIDIVLPLNLFTSVSSQEGNYVKLEVILYSQFYTSNIFNHPSLEFFSKYSYNIEYVKSGTCHLLTEVTYTI